MKKLLAILFAAMLCIALGVTALAGQATNVTVAGIELSNGEYLAEGATAKTTTAPADNYAYFHIDSESGKAILTLYNYDCTVDGQNYYCISWKGDLTIELPANTESSVTNENTNAGASGVSSDKTVAIQGLSNFNTLTVKGPGTLNATGYMHAIWAWSNITIEDGATVNATATIPSNASDATNSIALSTNNGGSVTINGATVAATGNVYGIGSSNSDDCPVEVTGNSTVTVKGGTKAIRGTVTLGKGLAAKASDAVDGTLGEYSAANLDSYKYIEIKKGADTPATYTVTYDANGGEGSFTDPEQYAAGEFAAILPTPATLKREGYVFDCWNTQADGLGIVYVYEDGDKIEVNGNVTLYAHWIPLIKVAFNAGEGTGTMDFVYYDPFSGTFTLPQCTFTPPAGKIFAGWSIPEREGVFASGDEVEFPGDIELTAVWKDAPVVEEDDPCKHEFDKEGICKHCKIQVIDHTKPENETNPNTGAPVVDGFAAIAVIAAACLCLGKRK